jgi:hypothetical protein
MTRLEFALRYRNWYSPGMEYAINELRHKKWARTLVAHYYGWQWGTTEFNKWALEKIRMD